MGFSDNIVKLTGEKDLRGMYKKQYGKTIKGQWEFVVDDTPDENSELGAKGIVSIDRSQITEPSDTITSGETPIQPDYPEISNDPSINPTDDSLPTPSAPETQQFSNKDARDLSDKIDENTPLPLLLPDELYDESIEDNQEDNTPIQSSESKSIVYQPPP